MSALQPSQVTSRANSDLCRIDLVRGDVTLSAPERMARIAVIVDESRAATAGATHDPYRSQR